MYGDFIPGDGTLGEIGCKIWRLQYKSVDLIDQYVKSQGQK